MSSVLQHPAESRPIGMRTRADLQLHESLYQSDQCWIIKDPINLKYFRLLQPEKRVLDLLRNPGVSYRNIKDELETEYPENEISFAEIQSLLASFHQNGLLVSEKEGQATRLISRRQKQQRQKSAKLLTSALALKLPGVDLEPFLSWLYPKVRWLFSSIFNAICLILIASAGILVLVNLDHFVRRLPEFEQFFGIQNIILMALMLIFTKSLHELGHGLACKHFGGECHEIGFMFLVLMPAMYCNTSDSWVLPNKWHRIAIGAAGMYVELILAAVCTFIWWYTQPGTVHYLALNVIFLCSVSTIVFNANPLLRYDGYYMLSDLLEIPNLSQKSRTALLSELRMVCLGMEPIRSKLQPQKAQWLFATYSVLSFAYRWFVILAILWFLATWFEPYGLSIIGHLLIVISLIGMIGLPAIKLVRFFNYPGRTREVNQVRLLTTFALVFAILAAVFLIPVPHHVFCRFVIQPANPQAMFVDTPGRLESAFVTHGESIKKGQAIARLQNSDLDLLRHELEGELSQADMALQSIRLTSNGNPTGRKRISEYEIRVSNIQKRLDIVEEQIAALTIVADRDGTVIASPNRPTTNPGPRTKQLAQWQESPLLLINRGTYLERGTMVCQIGTFQELQATLYIDQSTATQVKKGQQVELLLNEFSHQSIRSIIDQISSNSCDQIPRELAVANGGPIATQEQSLVPQSPKYEAVVPIENPDGLIRPGFQGQAKVRVESSTLGERMIRYFNGLIHFH